MYKTALFDMAYYKQTILPPSVELLLQHNKWATSWENLSSGVCNHVRHKPACPATETAQCLKNFGLSKYTYYTIWVANKEGTD